MLETLFLVFVVGAVAVLAFKFLFWLIVLPVKLGFWMFKGLLALIFAVPVTLFALGMAAFVVPLVLAVIALPFLIIGSILCFFFW